MGIEIKNELSHKLIALRKQNGFTQMELAEKLDVSRQAISRWEVGTAMPSTDNLRFLSELYGVTVDYLLNDDVNKKSVEPELLSAEQRSKPKTRKTLILVLLVVEAIIAAGLALMLTVTIFRNEEQNGVVPIEDMVVVEDDLTTYTFSFD